MQASMGRPLGLLISTIATTGFLLFGYDQGVMSGIISADPFNNYFPRTKDNSYIKDLSLQLRNRMFDREQSSFSHLVIGPAEEELYVHFLMAISRY